MKKSYLVVYDYGSGGVWAIINAHSKDEIARKYPMLNVHDERPNWMSDEHFKQVASARTFDIDDAPTGWLEQVLRKG
jgi:hypothetical protein